ncbi:MAG: DUF3332 domain-containing protein [Fibrobacter sp.]|jgi:flagellar basal body-associated protein FliL|nr:DUF3332 domain-containing protein [Fibrobacter sp.]
MKKSLMALLLAASFTLSGCYGSYALFHKFHKFNGEIGGKWINSVVHFIANVIPVYSIVIFCDLLVFNTIEFWTGSNVLASGDTYQETDANGNQISAVKNADGSLSVNLVDANGNKADFTLERDAEVIRAIDEKGNVIAQYSVNQ